VSSKDDVVTELFFDEILDVHAIIILLLQLVPVKHYITLVYTCVFSSPHHLKISAATVLDLVINYCDCVCSGIDDFQCLLTTISHQNWCIVMLACLFMREHD